MELKFNNKREFLSKFIELINMLDDDLTLPTQREMELLIELVLQNMEGDINDRKFTKKISKEHKFYARTLSIFKTKLVEKGWLERPSERKIKLNNKLNLKGMPLFIDIDIKFKYVGNGN